MYNYSYSKSGIFTDTLREIALEKEDNVLDCFKAVFENISSNYMCFVIEKDSENLSEIDFVSLSGKGVTELYICKENDFKLLKDETHRITSIAEIKEICEYNNEVNSLLKDFSVKQIITHSLESFCNIEDEIKRGLNIHLCPMYNECIIVNKSLKEDLLQILLKSDPAIVKEMKQLVSNPLRWHYNFDKDYYAAKTEF